MFFASSLIVLIKSYPVIAKYKIVDPFTIPCNPYSGLVNGVIFEKENLVKAARIINTTVTSLPPVTMALNLSEFFVPLKLRRANSMIKNVAKGLQVSKPNRLSLVNQEGRNISAF